MAGGKRRSPGFAELEHRIERESSFLSAVINNLPDAVFIKDTKGRFILANRAAAELMHAGEPENLVGKTDNDFYPSEMAHQFESEDTAVIEGRRLVNKEERRSVKGVESWLLITKVPITDQNGTIFGLIGICRDITSLREAQQAQQVHEENYRSIFMDAPVGIFRSTREGQLLSVNPMFAKMLGYDSPEQLIETINKKSIAEVLFEDPERRPAILDEILPEGGWTKFVNRYRRRDGGITIAQVMARMHPFADSLDSYLEGFVEDITERTQAEVKLAHQRVLLTALMDNIPDYIYFKDLQSRFILNNIAHARALGAKDPADMVGKTDFDYFAHGHARQAFDDEQRIIRTGKPLIDEVEKESWSDRPSTWVTSTKLPLTDETGTIVGTFGISRDITERHQLAQRNIRLAAMIESSNDAIIGIDLDDTVSSWNRGAEHIFGYTSAETIGKPVGRFIPAISSLQSTVTRIREKNSINSEMSFVRKDGKTVYIFTSLSLIEDAAGQILGITCISRDVTEQKALQAQLIRAQRLESLATLAAGISHHFNNINAAIKGYLELLATDEEIPTRSRSFTEEALKALHRSVEITERLQGLTSSSGGSQEAIRIEQAVSKILSLLEKELTKQAVSLETDFQETREVRISYAMLSFIVTTLISNATHALIGRASPKIIVRTRTKADFASIEVSDNGCGIAPENLSRIFSPFFTTKGEWAEPGSSQSGVKGIGLSLSVCQSTVTENGGWIEVESKLDEGTTFRAWFPVVVSPK